MKEQVTQVLRDAKSYFEQLPKEQLHAILSSAELDTLHWIINHTTILPEDFNLHMTAIDILTQRRKGV